MFKAILKICIFSLVLLFFASTAFALQTATLRLIILDPNSNIIPNNTVRLKIGDNVLKEIKADNNQELIFSNVEIGKYTLEIEAQGFKSKSQTVEIKTGKNELTVMLEIAEIVEEVKVESTAQEKAVEETFSNFLTTDQIANLPDDPEELEKELRRIAGGDNVIIRIDGFSGGRLPAKSQIASIRIVRSSYDSENHELGAIYVDVVTKVGNSRFSGSLSFNFNDESFNARNAFAVRRFPAQTRNILFYLSGPIIENKTNFSFFLIDSRNFEAQNIVAFLPSGEFNDSVNNQSASTYFDLNINHNLTKDLPIKVRYSFSDGNVKNLGVGGFNLSDRAFDLRNRSHEFRFSTSNNFAERFLNEFRFQYKNDTLQTLPQNNESALIILDSFSSGGAGNMLRNAGQSFWLADNLLFGYKQHALKIGGIVLVENKNQISALNQNGTFIFPSLQDFLLSRPSVYSQNPGIRRAAVSQFQIGGFIQDDVRITKGLILSVGIRYEWQNNLRDFNNFSPRLGFSWSPNQDGKTTFRGGIGIFYEWFDTETLLAIESQDQTQPNGIIIINPGFPNPYSGGIAEVLPPSYLRKAGNLKNPEVFHTSLGVQRRISKSGQLRLEYVYQKGLHQFRSRDINAPLNGIRPNSELGKITQIESSAFFVRNALNVGYDGRLTRNISFAINYTLSKIISDYNSIFSLPSDNYNFRIDRSVADNDLRHRFGISSSWQIRKGLRLSAIYSLRSPLPYTITTGRDDNNDTTFNDRPINTGRNSERGEWHNQLDMNFSYSFSFINRKTGNSNKGFSTVTTADEANSGFDFTDAEKRFSLKFFANAENLLNQANLSNYIGVLTSPFFGQATVARQSRKITFGLRFNF
ncbi:MAG: hypothetical protein ACR2J3_00060 [Aridibacter sp.]